MFVNRSLRQQGGSWLQKRVAWSDRLSECLTGFGFVFNFIFFYEGPSASGKTSFVMRLLKERERLLSPTPTRYHWCYQRYFKNTHELLRKEVTEIQFYDKFDYEYFINKVEQDPEERHCLILDDSLESPEELDLIFTRYRGTGRNTIRAGAGVRHDLILEI